MAFDFKEYYLAHADAIKQRVRAAYQAKKDDPAFKEKTRARREQQHFGMPRSVIFRKTDGQCYFCGKPAQVVHHLDEDGRTQESQNRIPGHDPSRLVAACRACHLDIHRDAMMAVKKTRANGYWSRQYACCIECGTTARKHWGHGLCVNCAARSRHQSKAGGV